MSIVSYAQNFEDVLLSRVFCAGRGGQYVDIGAQDPVIDSVSLAFYERGWRGIHVEAVPSYAARLREARPDEIVIEAAVTDSAGPIKFYQIEGTGISTGRLDLAIRHEEAGFAPHPILVPTITLEQLFERMVGEIHWMKVDVEGMEQDVLRSWRNCAKRPWVLVVEATYPGTQESTRDQWIDEILSRGYEQVHFDGLSCFFLHEAHRELTPHFYAPPNVFDRFVIAAPHFAAARLRGELEAAQESHDKERSRINSLQTDVDNAKRAKEVAQYELASTIERLKQIEQSNRDSRRESDEKEKMLREQILSVQERANAANVESARLEERSAQLQDKLRRADSHVAEQQGELTEVRSRIERAIAENSRLHSELAEARVENGQLRAGVVQAGSLIQAAIAERPGNWQRVGAALGFAQRSLWLEALSRWSHEAPWVSELTASNTNGEGNSANMPSVAMREERNPYLRADSLAELMSWHDLEFVRCAYVTVLGRQPDPSGEEYYLDRLRRGFSRYGILWQLRTSSEGRRHDPGIAGFDKELRKHRNARSRLYGWVFRSIGGRESDSWLERRLRAIETLIANDKRAVPVAATSSTELETLSAEISALSEILRSATQSSVVGSPCHAIQAEREAARGRLSPSGQKIFDRINIQ